MLGSIILSLLLAAALTAPKNGASTAVFASPEYRRHLAYVAAQAFAKRDLVSPSTATFSSEDDPQTYCFKRRDGWYDAGGYVDSQNGFGAYLRTQWHAVIRVDGNYNLQYLRVGDISTGDFPPDTPQP